MNQTVVFVIGFTGKRLMPTSPAKARKLLQAGKATIYQKRPFTIQLNYKTGATTQETVLGIDTGSQHIGVAVIAGEDVAYKAEITLRDSMEKRSLIEKRAEFRRNRRYRKTRYRRPKFRHHTKRVYSEKLVTRKSTKNKTHWVKVPADMGTSRPKGWLPPSIQSKLDHHIAWINRFLDVLPEGTKLNLELARFDIARMKDPSIHGEMYQRGPLYDYENVKAYVFARDHYRCKLCHKKGSSKREDESTVKLVAHHVLLKKEGATDNPEYLATVCNYCHTTENHNEGGELYKWYKENKRFARGFRDATLMNIVCKRLKEQYPFASYTYGNITAADRDRFKLEKSHANDAVAIAAKDMEKVNDIPYTLFYQQVRKKKRSLFEAKPRKGTPDKPNVEAKRNPKNMKSANGVCLFDKVKTNSGAIGWVTSFASGGYQVRLMDKYGKKLLVEGKEYDNRLTSTVAPMGHNNNWVCFGTRGIR